MQQVSRVLCPLTALAALVLPGCTEILGLGDITFYGPDATTRDAGPSDAGASDAARYVDVGPIDAGLPPSEPPTVIAPVNGANTGSPHVPDGTPVTNHPLRPRFFFLPVEGAHEYELQLDDSCPVSGFRACTFASPELDERLGGTPAPSGGSLIVTPSAALPVSMTPPVGSRYVWRIRACNLAGCGPWSEPRYLNVGRQDADYNGDGYADIAVGAANADDGSSLNVGLVFVHPGSEAGVLAVANTLASGSAEAVQAFGASLTNTGDIDADGFSDLLVAAPRLDIVGSGQVDQGRVFLFRGGPGGLSGPAVSSVANPSAAGRGFGLFGSTAGDLDGDGFGDVGVSGVDGAGYVLFGGPGGTGAPVPVPVDEATDAVSTLAAFGDIDGDGSLDLAIGRPLRDGPAGEAEAGSIDVYSFSLAREWQRVHEFRVTDSSHFGELVRSIGDLNGDGLPQLAALTSDITQTLTVLSGTPAETIVTTVDLPIEVLGVFAAGDVDNDGFDETLVCDRRVGNCALVAGTSAGPSGDASLLLATPLVGFGVAAAGALDVDGDGAADLAIGWTGTHDPMLPLGFLPGRVYVFVGPVRGGSPSTLINAPVAGQTYSELAP